MIRPVVAEPLLSASVVVVVLIVVAPYIQLDLNRPVSTGLFCTSDAPTAIADARVTRSALSPARFKIAAKSRLNFALLTCESARHAARQSQPVRVDAMQ